MGKWRGRCACSKYGIMRGNYDTPNGKRDWLCTTRGWQNQLGTSETLVKGLFARCWRLERFVSARSTRSTRLKSTPKISAPLGTRVRSACRLPHGSSAPAGGGYASLRLCVKNNLAAKRLQNWVVRKGGWVFLTGCKRKNGLAPTERNTNRTAPP